MLRARPRRQPAAQIRWRIACGRDELGVPAAAHRGHIEVEGRQMHSVCMRAPAFPSLVRLPVKLHVQTEAVAVVIIKWLDLGAVRTEGKATRASGWDEHSSRRQLSVRGRRRKQRNTAAAVTLVLTVSHLF